MLQHSPTVHVLRQLLLFMLWLGTIGTAVELLLLKHTDGAWQLTPLLLNALTFLVLVWYAVSPSAHSLRAIQAIMVLCLASGAVGVLLHFKGNVGYAQDSNPSIRGTELYREAVMGSTPTLAPGTMVQLALLGLAFAYRHPRFRGLSRDEEIISPGNPS